MAEVRKVRCYPCQECDALYDDEREAYQCCADWRGVDAWQCVNMNCEEIFHREEADARSCGLSMDCICSHAPRVHNVAQGWTGCYELDCRCPKYERVSVAA